MSPKVWSSSNSTNRHNLRRVHPKLHIFSLHLYKSPPPASASSLKIVINISDLLTSNKSSCRLIVDLLWRSGCGADLINGKKKVPGNYHSKPLRYKPVVNIDDDFEADFQEFKDYSDDEVEIDVKPFTFSASKKF
ncbi:Ethylene-responsive transcription factor RAP2-12 [Abeliophyllum distichum]|uniref:Ethylene-responsive transcription factor RAP2-12 n=1 Tax=Abeliophyllum distichum TaxID=126358 RepID=A0ABD1V9U2_9LAMI